VAGRERVRSSRDVDGLHGLEVIAVGPGGRDEAGKFIPIDVKARTQQQNRIAEGGILAL
jgi:hypothetical protein